MAGAEDDEWEYEYDETETEDFYITLDLSNIPDRGNAPASKGGSVKPSLSGHPILLQSRLRQLNAVRRLEENVVDTSNNGESAMGALQITGLHTKNPLIVYDNHLVSCNWSSAIGTDMFFVKPNPDAEDGEEPLRSLPAVDLLAVSSAKLMGTKATLRPTDEVLERVALSEEPNAVTTENFDGQPPTATRQVPPNTFLARLNEAKARRGETSRLVLSDTPNGSRLAATSVDANANEPEDVQMGGVQEGG